MYTFWVQMNEYLTQGTIHFFMVYFIFVWVAMPPRIFLALTHYVLKRYRYIQCYAKARFTGSALVTVYNEDPEDLWRCLESLRTSLEHGTKEWELIVLIDGISLERSAKTGDLLNILIASKFATRLLLGNARDKRRNLYALAQRARYEIAILVDSDTTFIERTIYELCLPFSDPKIGGTTTVQRIHEPKTRMQRVSDWMENARRWSSQGAMALYEQVMCLPGRAIALRTVLLKRYVGPLVNETFLGRPCISGDDRFLTNMILKDGMRTTIAPDAPVTTLAPAGFGKTSRMWTRWGRSSQRYTIQSPWIWRYPVAACIYWTDILLAPLTTFVVLIHWPYSVVTGHDLNVTLVEMTLYATGGILLSMALRQIPHLVSHPRDIILLPFFVLIATYLQFVRTYALLTIFKVNVWGTRAGADEREIEARTVHTEFGPDDLKVDDKLDNRCIC